MLELLHDLSTSWFSGTVRTLEGLHRGLTEPFPVYDDPPPITPYEVIYTAGKASLRYYRAGGKPHATPLLIVKEQEMAKLIETFNAKSAKGKIVIINEWQPVVRVDNFETHNVTVPGTEYLLTSDGKAVTKNEDGTYKIRGGMTVRKIPALLPRQEKGTT